MLLLSPCDRQSGELAAKVFGYYGALGQPIGSRKRTDLQLHLVNGDRVIALPKNEKTIRGFLGARLLVVDETSRVSETQDDEMLNGRNAGRRPCPLGMITTTTSALKLAPMKSGENRRIQEMKRVPACPRL